LTEVGMVARVRKGLVLRGRDHAIAQMRRAVCQRQLSLLFFSVDRQCNQATSDSGKCTFPSFHSMLHLART